MKVVDVGSGAAGFQFVLADAGLDVLSVDPLVNPSGTVNWQFENDDFHRLNQAFGSKVRFIRKYLEDAALESESVDRVFAVSVLEHLSDASLTSLVMEVARILKPGGAFVATIDLFLDCHPFTRVERNEFGRNVSVKRVIEESGLTLESGLPRELFGFDEFDADRILRDSQKYLVGRDVMTHVWSSGNERVSEFATCTPALIRSHAL